MEKKSEPEPELESDDDAEAGALLETFIHEECDDAEDDRAPALHHR